MWVITTKKTDSPNHGSEGPTFKGILKKAYDGAHTIRFVMLSTYIAVTLITLILMSAYITGILSENLYSEETNKLYAKANIISQTACEVWDSDEENLLFLRFEDIITRSLAGTNIRGVITNNSYTVLYDTNSEAAMTGKVFMRSVLKRALDGEQADLMFNSDSGKTATVAVPVENGTEIIGGVYLAENVSSINDTISAIKTSLIVFCVMIVFVLGILSIGVSYIITQPFSEFTEVAKAISKGDFSRRASVKGMNEIAEMGRALNYMCDELNELDEKRKNFVSDVSHELKTPMAGIKLLCDTLVEAGNPDMETVREFLGDMSQEIDRLTRLINRLLTLSRLDAGKNRSCSDVDICALCGGVVRSLGKLSAEKAIIPVLDTGILDKLIIIADYDKIYEAVYNIVDNAIKYTPPNGNVTVRVDEDEENCIIDVEDNGPGIPEGEKTKIFDRFYRLDDSRARDTGGTGLGLAIAKEAILLHGGTIGVTDAPDGGSVFRIQLPKRPGGAV
ncbi:MAG: ATP-binding protein [Clostridiales bacterium]|nr:ATP-binding protein [Clostridiales bacterium]